ncbi:Gfo/Idh/MocA family protein [Novosphingobium cyanobacteriorum]|uniref:Gfo/Idh/MocA family oxidoreductase n=1 Tax=Novosphingobium cyanobacteriorum TaxID=3024215 RepID=A0ABT6CGX7_9SPHN|nr:Gfo/Idh/MocA family oxidoreductase [Novosphingobium cyanobacteriorum]MDF8332779.1 Gfo/Idh/MocA family oxidoreductase [Novosphingobium cyanobacteriorum]
MDPIRIAIVGMGKIARDQHLPAIAGNRAFGLAATVSPHDPGVEGVPHFAGLDDLLASGPAVDAVALCTPPQVRHDLASSALARGIHVFLEKPPGATLGEVAALQAQADKVGASLFAAWHSRFAAGVAPARAWLAERTIERVTITWREDVRVWHPGQAWIWEPGGLGVFDPGINALSIVTHILPRPIFLRGAKLEIPANRVAPIAADMTFSDTGGAALHMDLDWRQTGPQSWDIVVETDAGTLKLSQGGAVLTLPTGTDHAEDHEYPALYARFATLIRTGRSDVDVAPLRLVADAFLRGTRVTTNPFVD